MSKKRTSKSDSNTKTPSGPDLFNAPTPTVGSDMDKYGIKCIAVTSYVYGEYKYSNLEDAVSQAKRDEAKNISPR